MAFDALRDRTFLGGAKLCLLEWVLNKAVKASKKRETSKLCELKGGIVEKAQETRIGMSPKYSRYIGIAC